MLSLPLLSPQASLQQQQQCWSSSAPPQPVPPLSLTLQRYLQALEPLLPPDELSHSRRMVQEFGRPGGLGSRLQKGLEIRARHTRNWITDWWVQWAYLENREPLAVHSNPAISLPRRDFNDWRSQLVFASKLIAAVLDFKAMVDR
uniref:Choline/carnitine acyltransferase domain-containing protein n=1 Tax=Knipowitschia caucasica TaxID=637954 RepID=A0AAV2K6Y0_KNICA